jgi:hypothetical protein
MTWIPVLDNKPKDLPLVLIFDDVDEYIIGYYYEAGGFFVGSVDGARISKARFWKPLPESLVLREEMDSDLPAFRDFDHLKTAPGSSAINPAATNKKVGN